MKFIRNSLLVLILVLFSFKSVSASTIDIDVKATNVANILLEIVINDKDKAEDGLKVYLYSKSGDLIDTVTSKDSKVFFENVPFGDYIVRVDEGSGYVGSKSILVDKEFVENQHIPLVYNIYTEGYLQDKESQSLDTGDYLEYRDGVLLMVLSVFGLIGLFYSRRVGDSREEVD